jgi:hypothetical protein
MKKSFLYLLLFCFALSHVSFSEAPADSLRIRVHFLYGSKPKRKYRAEEDRWFGGVLGGHVGIEYEPGKIVSFQPTSHFHIFSNRRIINSKYGEHDTVSFYGILDKRTDSMKRTIISIPVTRQQKHILDSLRIAYENKCPYDYAFFGMRCGAAAYDVLARIGVVKPYSFGKTWRKIFYPRKLRRLLERQAAAKGYIITRRPGTPRRKWEKD